MELACMKAARKLIFEYLEETVGYGWWGDNKNKEFYENLSGADNPWNWVRCLSFKSQPADIAKDLKGDHAGQYECAMLEYLFPGTIQLDRLKDTDDWFAQDSIHMSVQTGEELIKRMVEGDLRLIRNEE